VGAGALGIAAGTLLSPLLLSAGMNPLVTVASTGMMVLFTSSSTAVQYLILGRLQADYALFFMSVGVVAAVVGNTLIHFIVRKYKKTWFVVAILAITIILSTFLLGYTGFYRTMRSWLQDEDMGFRDLCDDRSHMLEENEGPKAHGFPWVSPVDMF